MGDEILIDPEWLTFEDGQYRLTEHSSHHDVYFETDQTSALGHALDRLVDTELGQTERACIELRVFAGLPYSHIAVELDWWCGDPPYPNRKRAWRTTRRALAKLADAIGDRSGWLAAIGDQRITDMVTEG